MLARPDEHDPGEPIESASPRVRQKRRGPGIGSIVVIAVIAIQIIVPTIGLLLPPPQRFGFQMYSGVGASFTTEVLNEEGSQIQFDAANIVGKLRPEIDWLTSLPEALCVAVPDAAQARVEQSAGERTIECD